MIQLNERSMEKAQREVEAARMRRTNPVREIVRARLDGYGPRPRISRPLRTRPIMPPRFASLIAEVEEQHGLDPGLIFSDSNVRMFVEARREAFVLLREAGLSYPFIGYLFGMHHTSVLHQVKKAPKQNCGKVFQVTSAGRLT